MCLRLLKDFGALVGWKQAKLSVVKKTRLNSSNDNFVNENPSFVHKRETQHSFELSLFICVFYRCIFNLKMQNFSLENHGMANELKAFCW